jgi:hypothetical protein
LFARTHGFEEHGIDEHRPSNAEGMEATPERMRDVSKTESQITHICLSAANFAFGQPLVNNVLRAIIAEAIVNAALPDGWRWCSVDYNSFDFQHADGTKLEVKQSAAKQSWALPEAPPSKCSFDIAARTGRWEGGSTWIAEIGRNADIYIFAHHPVVDASADHRNPEQWRFFATLSNALPSTKRLSIAKARALSAEWTFGSLAHAVEDLRRLRPEISSPGSAPPPVQDRPQSSR